MSLHDQLLDIERTLWTGDPVIYQRTLIEEAVLVFGGTGPIGRDAAIEAIRKQAADGDSWTDVHIDDAITLSLDANAALLTYRASASRRSGHLQVLATSDYVRRGDDWKLVLHQQTPASP